MNALPSLRDTMMRGATCLAPEGGEAIVAFVRSRQCPDGGFAGRSRSSDLYYTLFAAATLNALNNRRALWKLSRYLTPFGDGAGLDFVHLACLAQLLGGLPLRGRRDHVLAHIEMYRSRDGGYHHATKDAETGSAYAIHLAIETYAGVRHALPHTEGLSAALETLHVPGGGYANAPGQPFAQTNATAAACVAQVRLGLQPPRAAVEFLLAQHDAESGGFRAHPQARISDLLSTASALYALCVAGTPRAPMAPRCRAFVESLWTDEGGFCGTHADPIPDCEYTAYALLALGALL